jgi:hypothetical protein
VRSAWLDRGTACGEPPVGERVPGDRVGPGCVGLAGALGSQPGRAGRRASPDNCDHVVIVFGLMHQMALTTTPCDEVSEKAGVCAANSHLSSRAQLRQCQLEEHMCPAIESQWTKVDRGTRVGHQP